MWTLACRRPSGPSMPKNSFQEIFVKQMKNELNAKIWTSQRTGIFKKPQDVEQNAAPLSTTFWTHSCEPEMDLEDDFNHVAQTLQIPMKGLISAFPRHRKTV